MDTPAEENEQPETVAPVAEGMVRLESGDGFSFTVDAEYARISTVIDVMLSSSFRESHTRIIRLPHVRGRVLELVCQYFYYVARFRARRTALPPLDGGGDGISAVGNIPSTNAKIFDDETIPKGQISQVSENASLQKHYHVNQDEDSTFHVPPQLAVDLFLLAKYLNL